MPYARSKDGINLHYRIHDCTDEWKNAPYLILQHGYARSSKFWNRMVPYLCRWYKVICPDLRGLGESSKDFDLDARINVALATTAAMAGAVVANHVRVVDLRKVGGSAVHGSHAADRPFLFCRMSRAPFGA